MPHLWKTVSLGAARMLGMSLARLKPSEVEDLAQFYLRGRAQKEALSMETFAREIAVPTKGAVYDAALNGEDRLLERTRGLGFSVLFDVGANRGEWAARARAIHTGATIHCFEIVPSTFALLEARLGGTDRVALNPFGLSDTNGSVDVYVTDDAYVSSMHDFRGDHAKRVVPCRVMRGEDYARQAGIERIDFLKIDVEGAEGRALRGMGALFDRKLIRLVQFEYNRGAIESRFLLLDFYKFFTARGYLVGKLTQQGVAFRDYEYALEDFIGPNYVACLASDRATVEAVSTA